MTTRRHQRPPAGPRREGSSSPAWLLVFIPFALLFVYLVVPGPWRGDDDASPASSCAAGCGTSGGTSAPIAAAAPAVSEKPALPKPYANQDPDRWKKSTQVPPPQIYGPNAAVVEASCGQLVYGLKQD